MDMSVYGDIVACLPSGRTLFHYERDYFSVMLLRYLLETGTPPRALKSGRYARLFEKEPVRRFLATHGSLDFGAGDVRAIAMADPLPWRLTIGHWGHQKDNRYKQTARRGFNIVLQLNFVRSHNAGFDKILAPCAHPVLANYGHPVSRKDRTLAWARIDLDFDTGEALIEEIQSDWVRDVAACAASGGLLWHSRDELCVKHAPRFPNKEAARKRTAAYSDKVLKPLAVDWQETMLAAALFFIIEELGLRRVFMYQFETGNLLKRIGGTRLPPRSIYTDLPRQFCFARTSAAPWFLTEVVERVERRERRKKPLSRELGFWHLDLTRPRPPHEAAIPC